MYLEEYIYIAIINIENASIIREQNNILEYGGQFKFSVGTNKYIYIYKITTERQDLLRSILNLFYIDTRKTRLPKRWYISVDTLANIYKKSDLLE